MGAMRVWAVVTAAAIVVIPVLDLAVRLLVDPGWIFAFVFVVGAPIWLASVLALGWTARGLVLSTSAFTAATTAPRAIVLTLLWVYLAALTLFCWFMSDGGDADDWQSPAGRLLGVHGYNSRAPEYLWHAERIAMPALGIGFLALLAAVIGYALVGQSPRRTPAPVADPNAAVELAG